MDTELKNLEKRHKISQRWTRDNEDYIRLVHYHDESRQLKIIYQMRSSAVEKDFLYDLRKKYSGI